MGAGAPLSPAAAWLAQVNTVQQSRLSHAAREAFLARAEVQRSARILQATSHMVQASSNVCTGVLRRGLQASSELSGARSRHGTAAGHAASPAAFGFRATGGAAGVLALTASAATAEERVDMSDGAAAGRAWNAVSEGASETFSRSRRVAEYACMSSSARGAAAAAAAGAASHLRVGFAGLVLSSGARGDGGGADAAAADGVASPHVAEAMAALEAGEVAAPEAAEEGGAGERMGTLLEQMRVEPEDADELRAKFTLFEEYMSTVTAMRDQVLALWTDSRPSFDAGPAGAAVHVI